MCMLGTALRKCSCQIVVDSPFSDLRTLAGEIVCASHLRMTSPSSNPHHRAHIQQKAGNSDTISTKFEVSLWGIVTVQSVLIKTVPDRIVLSLHSLWNLGGSPIENPR